MTRAEAATAFVDHFVEMPFEWGPETDCAGRIGWYLERAGALPGSWPEALAAPRTDTRTARFVMKRFHRAATFACVVSRAFPSIAPLEAATGDLAAIPAPSERDPAVGVLIAGRVFVTGPDGLVASPITDACAAWRVPE